MTIIVCIDDSNGILFNNRRQSRDRCLIEDVVSSLCGSQIFVDDYSAALFAGYSDSIQITDDPLCKAGKGDICFIERQSLCDHVSDIEKVIVYRWNRAYPADKWLDVDLTSSNSMFKKIETCEINGYSHELITKEVYINEKMSSK